MKIVISEIPDEGLDVAIDEKYEDYSLIAPVHASLKIEKIDTEVIIRGNISTEITLQCSRCLEDYPNKLSFEVDVVYHPLEEIRSDETHEIKNDELDMAFYEGDVLDLTELINEQVILILPMKPLCSEKCAGICMSCGQSLNAGKCKCAPDSGDPRFRILKKLLNNKS